jgi:Tfp pilus assembly major pilin PilA
MGELIMKTRSSQQGMSLLSWMVVIFVVSILVTVVVKLVPVYMDSLTVKSIVEDVASQQKLNSNSTREIRKALESQFMVNRVEAITAKDVKIIKEKGKIFLNANYEKRVPVMYNVDAVVKFENLVFEVTPASSDN